jgi:mRNA interferase RelE/StbE
MVFYENKIKKGLKRGKPPKDIFIHINNAFIAIDQTKDLSLFDIKKLKETSERNYYRLRKGKYRAIFYFEKNDIYVIALDKREDVYKEWA